MESFLILPSKRHPLTVSAFTFVRNAIKFDYPVTEAIRSVLPLCDVMVVAVGRSEDATRDRVHAIGDPRIRIIDTVWDDSMREGGRVLAVETNKAFAALNPESTWAFYIQADEVLHERYLPTVRAAMEKYAADQEVEGLLFRYLHFWGSYGYIGDSRQWYRREIRVVRNDPSIRSWQDAQGFRKEGRKLQVAPVDACIHHYGWVKPPQAQQAKLESFHRYWHSDRWIEKSVTRAEIFDYQGMEYLSPFTGTHPQVMAGRIAGQDWHFEPRFVRRGHSLKSTLLHFLEQQTGWRPGEYRNYRLIR